MPQIIFIESRIRFCRMPSVAKTVIRVIFDDATAAEGFLERCRGEGLNAVVKDARPIGTVKRNGPVVLERCRAGESCLWRGRPIGLEAPVPRVPVRRRDEPHDGSVGRVLDEFLYELHLGPADAYGRIGVFSQVGVSCFVTNFFRFSA